MSISPQVIFPPIFALVLVVIAGWAYCSKAAGKSPKQTAEKRATEPLQNNMEAEKLTLEEWAQRIVDEDVKGLILDRLEEIEEEHGNPEKEAMLMVDLMDELKLIHNVYKGTDAESIAKLSGMIRATLEQKGCELLDCDTWNPDTQRAVKIDYCLAEEQAPVITAKQATGLKYKGKLLRKQEVKIQKAKIA